LFFANTIVDNPEVVGKPFYKPPAALLDGSPSAYDI
jgi:hypothetical protein